MTIEQAFDYIECALYNGCPQICNAKMRKMCTDEQMNEAVTTLREMVEDRIKYQWHDLFSNPHDLPELNCVVEVYTVYGDYYHMKLNNETWWSFATDEYENNQPVWYAGAWRYIQPPFTRKVNNE